MLPSSCRCSMVVILTVILLVGLTTQTAFGIVSDSFYEKNGEIYDSWYVIRTEAFTRNGNGVGFLGSKLDSYNVTTPIVYESMGAYSGIIRDIGRDFKVKYPTKYYRAQKIFRYVRDNVQYAHDSKLFGYNEFAQNPDELAKRIENGEGKTYGDCEDVAILLAALFESAEIDSGIVVVPGRPGHAAALVYLPNYPKANHYWKFKKSGWVWAEATGRRNYLGWTPERVIGREVLFEDVKLKPKLQEIEIKRPEGLKEVEVGMKETRISNKASPFLIMVLFMWIMPILARLFM